MTVFLTVLAGVATFVLGQLVVRLFVEPVQEMKRTIADVATAIITHANVYSNLGVTGPEREKEVSTELRALASRLNAQLYLVPIYKATRHVFGLPSKNNVSRSVKNLIGISNGVHVANNDMGTVNAQKSDRICELLGIHNPDASGDA